MADNTLPFRFGVEMMGPFPGLTWPESVRELEASGYATLFAPDHFDEGYGPITCMATAAAVSSTLTVATGVLATDFRHPAVLARELASIDVLSGGRLEVGLGAGYQVADYEVSGLDMADPRIRVDRLEEQVAILRGLFAAGDDPFSFEGRHYAVRDMVLLPRPHRVGGPRLFVAGGGRRMLGIAARNADIVGVNPALPTSARRDPRDGLPDAVDRKFAWIREAAGPRFGDIEFHAWVRYVDVTGSRSGAVARLRDVFSADSTSVLQSPIVLVGDVAEIVEQVLWRRERWGYTYFTVQQQHARAFAPVVAALTGGTR